jgi:radical SAM superfamily enzyme YgiQ (UPF0313 family)
MGLKLALLQIGYDLELQYNVLKSLLPDGVVMDRHYLIDYYIDKQIKEYPRRDKKFSDLFITSQKRAVVNFQQFLPVFLLMADNFKKQHGFLYGVKEKFEKLKMGNISYNFDMIEKMLKQTGEFLVNIKVHKYDIICIGTTDGGVYNAVMAMLFIKSRYPEKKIVIGGKAFKSYKELREILYRLKLVDTFVDGDGELALKTIVTQNTFPKEMCMTIVDLNELPIVEPGFGSFLWNEKNSAANIYSSRGCVHNCSFCNEGIYPFRCVSADALAENINMVVKKYNTYRFIIADNLLCPSKTYIEKFYKRLESLNLVGKLTIVFAQIPVKHIDIDIIKMMKKLDARVFMGAESFSQNVLDRMDKGTTVEMNIDVIEKSLKHGLDIDIGRMAMFPGETMEDFQTSIKYFSKYLPQTAQSVWINVLALYSSTPMYENPEKYDIRFEYFDERIQNIIPEVGDIVKRYPYNYIDLTDPNDEIFDRKNKMLRVVNEVLSMAFEKKWNKDYSHIK